MATYIGAIAVSRDQQDMENYERGAKLKAHCEGKLKDAQLKVEKIVLDGNGNSAGTAPFDAG